MGILTIDRRVGQPICLPSLQADIPPMPSRHGALVAILENSQGFSERMARKTMRASSGNEADIALAREHIAAVQGDPEIFAALRRSYVVISKGGKHSPRVQFNIDFPGQTFPLGIDLFFLANLQENQEIVRILEDKVSALPDPVRDEVTHLIAFHRILSEAAELALFSVAPQEDKVTEPRRTLWNVFGLIGSAKPKEDPAKEIRGRIDSRQIFNTYESQVRRAFDDYGQIVLPLHLGEESKAVARIMQSTRLAEMDQFEGVANCHAEMGQGVELNKVRPPERLAQGKGAVALERLQIGEKIKVVLILGGNSSGKSELMRTILYAQLRHQMGLSIPAESATLSTYQAIVKAESMEADGGRGVFETTMANLGELASKARGCRTMWGLDEVFRGTAFTPVLAEIANKVFSTLTATPGSIVIATTNNLGFIEAMDRDDVLVLMAGDNYQFAPVDSSWTMERYEQGQIDVAARTGWTLQT